MTTLAGAGGGEPTGTSPAAETAPGAIGVEPFEASYGAGFEAQEDQATAVECEVAEDGGEFGFHEAEPVALPDRCCFVDGVMRTEARLTRVGSEGETRLGLAGSWAVGAVLIEGDGPARVARMAQGRAVVFTGGEPVTLPAHRNGWAWTPSAVEGDDVDAARARLRDMMRDAEAALAERLCGEGWTVVLDGPLHSVRRRVGGQGGRVMGYVKTHHRRMLAVDQWRRVPGLATGQRTSLFATKVGLYACYVRVGSPGPWAGGWAGVARLEFPQDIGLDAAAGVAQGAAAWLPGFASELHRDARAPVNLTPVAGLERRLRRTLGDARLAVRAVREAVMALNSERQER